MVDDRYFDTKYLQNGGKGNEIKTTMHIDDTLARIEYICICKRLSN